MYKHQDSYTTSHPWMKKISFSLQQSKVTYSVCHSLFLYLSCLSYHSAHFLFQLHITCLVIFKYLLLNKISLFVTVWKEHTVPIKELSMKKSNYKNTRPNSKPILVHRNTLLTSLGSSLYSAMFKLNKKRAYFQLTKNSRSYWMQKWICIISTYSYKACEFTTLERQCCSRAKSSHEYSYIPIQDFYR